MKKSNKRKGINWEKKVEKCIASGALWFNKGDLRTDDYLIEAKYTGKKGYRISTKILKKLWVEALEANKLPLLIIGIEDEDSKWILKVEVNKEGI